MSGRTGIDAEDYFGSQQKKLALADRRPVITRGSDLGLGPGISATAVLLDDFNNLLATFDGFFSVLAGSVGSPTPTGDYVGTVVSDAELGGQQTFTNLATGIVYSRIFVRNPAEASVVYWGSWKRLSPHDSEARNVVVVTNGAAQATINFYRGAFPSPPVVTCTGGNGESHTVVGVTTLGFTVQAFSQTGALLTGLEVRVLYNAVESH